MLKCADFTLELTSMRAKFFVLGLLTLIGLLMQGCGGSVTSQGISRVRALNLLDSPASIDVVSDGTLVALGLGTGNLSGYSQVQSGFVPFNARPDGSTNTIASFDLTASNNVNYTVVAYKNSSNQPAMSATIDDYTAPDAGLYKVRIIHLDRLVGNVDLYVTQPDADLADETPVVTNVPFEFATGYYQFTAGSSLEFRITNAGTKTVIGQALTLNPNAGVFRSIAIYDNSGVQTKLISDNG
ncbi:MAG: hypothetical protein BGO01_11965 [Armatimonadetes bacterium 55-13]|nr:MAG: hypothetical protein BGO01_11965 [Armatimonadetes bacterium 55-13]